MNPVEINDLISSTLSKLTGDFDSDLKYLLNEMQKYKDHENGLEITRAIGRVIGDMIPDEQKEKFLQLLDNEQLKDDTLLDQAGFYIYKKEFNKAYSLLNNYLTKFEESKWFVDDELSEYHYFRDQIEKLLYILICKPKKDVEMQLLIMVKCIDCWDMF